MTTTDSEAERIRGYLISQANKLSIPDLVAKVRDDSAALKDAAAAVPSEKFGERPGPDDWSAAEVFTHVLDMTENGAGAIEDIIAAGAAPPRIRDELRHEQRGDLQSAADYWQAFETRRGQLYEHVLRAAGDEHLDVKITHPTFGAFSWREWFLFMRVHDLDHMRQLQSIADHFRG
jgi:hypothetical protein